MIPIKKGALSRLRPSTCPAASTSLTTRPLRSANPSAESSESASADRIVNASELAFVRTKPTARPVSPRTTSAYFSTTQTRRNAATGSDSHRSPAFSDSKEKRPQTASALKTASTSTANKSKATVPSGQATRRRPHISIESETAPKTDKSPAKKTKWQPAVDWHRTLELLREMRRTRSAPVDSMGCHRCVDVKADERTRRFHILVALMLSSQTKDQITYDTMRRLFGHAPGGLTPRTLLALDADELAAILHPVSFYRVKAKHLLATARILVDQFEGDIPDDVAKLVRLPGVGPKMAHICMSAAWQRTTGIGVDTHVHRITNRLRWTPEPTSDAERTRKALEDWLPVEHWSDVNLLMVGFGQTVCTPRHPKCKSCLLADSCPSRGVKE